LFTYQPPQDDSTPNLRSLSQDFNLFSEKSAFVFPVKHQEITGVKEQSLYLTIDAIPGRSCSHIRPVERIQQREKRNHLPPARELMGDFVSNGASQAIAAYEIGSFRLHAADFVYVQGCHLFHCGKTFGRAIQSLRLQAVERLVGTKVTAEITINEHIAASAVDTEKRQP